MPSDFDLDRESELMLLLLQGNPMKTSELREELGFDKNQKVNYRGKRVLGSGRQDGDLALGFVEHREADGSNTRENVWSLTSEGSEWVAKHRDGLEPPQNATEAVDLFGALREDLLSFESRFQQVEGDHNAMKQKVEELHPLSDNPHAEHLRARIYRLEKNQEKWRRRMDKLEERMNQLEDLMLERD